MDISLPPQSGSPASAGSDREEASVQESGIGTSVRRKEDARFLTGRGRYVDDFAPPGVCHAVFVRSPHAHARIRRVDYRSAASVPGVIGVFTGAYLTAAGVGSIPCAWLLHDRFGRPMAEPPHYPLAIDKVRHVGEPVVMVVAQTLLIAKDAAELVTIDYEVLPAVADVAQALREDAPRVWDDVGQNLCCDWETGDAEAVSEAFARAAHVTRIELVNNRLVPHPLEPRAALALCENGDYTLYTTSQNPHLVRASLCRILPNLPETRLRVISPDVGGGFGTKAVLYPEETVLTWVAGQLARPIRWTSDRSEAFLTDAHGRDHRTCAELALAADGTFLGLRVRTLANVGAYLSVGSTAIPTLYYAPLLTGVYRTPAIHCSVLLCFTHTCSVDAYRGAGRPEATYVLERLIDQAARETGRDRVALRRQNFIRSDDFPYRTPLGLEYDSGDHEATLDLALKTADWDGFSERRRASRERGLLRGIGLSTYVEIAGGTPSKIVGQLGGRGGRAEAAQIRVHPGGSVTVFSGAHSHGQGHETTFAQIVADRLGISIDSVRVVQGDTDAVPFGRGTVASRSLVIGGSAIIAGLEKIITKATKIAAHLLEASLADIEFDRGRFRIVGTDRSLPFAEVAKAAYVLHDYPIDQIEPGLDETAFYDPLNWTFPGGCHICEIELDPETGVVTLDRVVAVDDLGRIINPMIVEGQIHGGLAQGLGQALFEGCVYDESGQLVTASLMDYGLPRAVDFPSFSVLTHGTDCEHNPLKAKGCAEVGSVGIPPAVINAILDALQDCGVISIDMPATPQRIWKAIAAARRASSA